MEPVTETAPVGDITVLLVDDEVNILQSLQRLLRRETFRIVTAGSGADGLQLLSQLSNVALIVSDQRMPQMNGAEFLERSRSHAPDAVRMLLTGYTDLGDAVDAINHGGISRYLSKPWDDTDLLQAIRGAVETYQLAHENKRLQELVSKQNQELQEWNCNLKERVMQQTAVVRQKNEELQQAVTRQKEASHKIIFSLVSLVEMRGKRSRMHAHNVEKLAGLVAADLGLPLEEQQTIKTAAMLHDVGEIGISERILLSNPESMPRDDYIEYSQHPVRGQLLIDPIEELRPAGVYIRHHHEKYDGSGFPDQLAGEAIPLGARIVAYADLVDRAVRQCVSNIAEQALQWTDIHVGKSLDPALRRVFHRFVKYVYFPAPKHGSSIEAGERDVKLDGLEPGMTLARSVYSGSGILLLPSGTALDTRHIESLQRYHQLDPSDGAVFILKPGRTTGGVMV